MRCHIICVDDDIEIGEDSLDWTPKRELAQPGAEGQNGKIAEEWVSRDELGMLLSAGVIKADVR